MARNMFKIIDETRGTVPARYDMNVDELKAIIKDASSNNGTFDAIIYAAVVDAFNYGFALGRRYERNQIKKEG